jgi:hypothetical protein
MCDVSSKFQAKSTNKKGSPESREVNLGANSSENCGNFSLGGS